MSDTIHECGSDILIAKIDKGKKVVESILEFCKNNQIKGAWITGLGALSEVKLAFYQLDKKSYLKKTIKQSLEICSLSGNIGMLDKEHVTHLHIVVSDENMSCFGGHLEEATVAATCELKVEIFDHPINRKYDDEIGLNLIEIN